MVDVSLDQRCNLSNSLNIFFYRPEMQGKVPLVAKRYLVLNCLFLQNGISYRNVNLFDRLKLYCLHVQRRKQKFLKPLVQSQLF